MNCAFSSSHYREAIEKAKGRYDIRLFREWRPAGGRRRLFLRHDLDHSLRLAVEMARLEHAAGVRATYFVQLHAELYSASSADAAEAIREISSLGHEIGLHFDTGYFQRLGLDSVRALQADLDQLAQTAGTAVESVSRHSPVDSPSLGNLSAIVRWDAYSDRFIKEIKYLSDSNRVWREGCFCTRLDEETEMQVLTHPIWWLAPGETMRHQILNAARAEAAVSLEEAKRIASYYEDCLMSRPTLDRRLKDSGF